ncbi:hypothetical protein GCM10007968_11070 [Sporolactobacillus putidus]|uniref:Uncharacterized protein n=1 Tax=Sporolactobacillus putidus TaxID=492735 RepID=A0A917VZE4_9BACL|nr:hypothetical protein GCM10007968_11070 [Sporolactobacillus putidus]
MERPEDLLPAFEETAVQKCPCIIDIVVDADEAPMPSNITFSQASGYARHMIKALFEEGKVDLPPL